jgi:hypothetical protein
MFANRELVRKVVNRVRAAARETVDDLIATRVEHETQFTDRFLGNLRHQLNGKTIAGVQWRVKTLTDRVKKGQEQEFGADFMGALDVEIEEFSAKKGFLAQAKRLEPSAKFPASEASRLRQQCDKMLSHTPDSFVFLYSAQSGVTVVPAIAVVGARDCNPHELTSKPVAEFFGDHLECFIGDPKIQSADIRQLDALRANLAARTAFTLQGRAIR